MRRSWIAAAVAAVGVGLVVAASVPSVATGGEEAKAAFAGAASCKKCHLKQFKSWSATPMSKAYEHLKPDQAADKKTAAKLDPKADYSKDPKCLKCHTTGYGTESGHPAVVEGKAWSEAETARAALTQGVTCEACHGPGSLYGPYKKDNPEYKRADIVARGAVSPPTAAICQACHEAGGCPTMGADYKFDFEAAKKKHDAIHEEVPLKKPH